MKRFLFLAMFAGAMALMPLTTAHADIFNNGPPQTGSNPDPGALDISLSKFADDFTISSSVNVNRLLFYVEDFSGPFDLTGGEFSGQFSWFVYNDASGLPGATIASGTVGIGQFQLTDTGLTQTYSDVPDPVDIALLDIPIAPLNLTAGTYWLRLKEGTLTSPYDLTSIYWVATDTPTIPGSAFSNSTTDPGWSLNTPDRNLAFIVVAAPEPSSLPLALAALPLIGLVARRKRG